MTSLPFSLLPKNLNNFEDILRITENVMSELYFIMYLDAAYKFKY